MTLKNKILLGIAGIFTSFMLILAFSAGDLGKYIILKYGPQYTGRKIELEKLNLNIFNAKSEFTNFKIYEKDEKTLFFSIDKLDLDLNLPRLFVKDIKIESLGLENPKLSIRKNGNKYNFTDIIENIQSKGNKEKQTPQNNKESDITLNAFQLKNFNFEYKDDLMEDKFKIKLDSFDIPLMTINKDITFCFHMLSKGNLELQTNVKINDKEILIDTPKLYANVDTFLPFIQTMLNVSKFSGEVDGANKIKINLLKGGLEFNGKTTYKNLDVVSLDKESLFKIDSIALDIKKMSTADEILEINSFIIDKPFINFDLYKKGFNLLKIMKEGESNMPSFKNYKISEFAIKDGLFKFRDSSKQEVFDYNFSHINISTSPITHDVEAYKLNIGLNPNSETARLETELDVKNKKFNDVEGTLSAQNIRIDEFTHYIKDFVNVSSVRGVYDGNIKFKYTSKNKTPYFNMKGDSRLSDFSIIDKKKLAEIINLKSLKLNIDEISIPDNRIVINSVEIDKPKLYGYIAKDGNIMQLLIPGESKDSKPKAKKGKPMFFELKSLSLKNGNIKFSDDTFKKPFTYVVDVPSIIAKNISTQKNNRNSMYKVDLVANKTGKISASGDIRVGENFETNSRFRIANFKFEDFKEITEKYSNFIANNGVLNYDGTLVLKNKKISSQNNAKVLNIDIGEKEKILPLGISLNFVFSIIENKNKEITLILPIEGDLTNPEFKYWKTVRIALKNVFVNIAKAPFKFMMSDDEDTTGLETLDLDFLKQDLPKDSIKKLEKIAKIIKNKPLLKFEFIQVIDKENEYKQLVMKEIKTKYYVETNKITELTQADLDKIENISDLSVELVEYINSKTIEIADSDKMDIYKKSEMIVGRNNIEKDFVELYLARNRFISDKLKESGIEATNMKVRNATGDESGDVVEARYIVNITSTENTTPEEKQ